MPPGLPEDAERGKRIKKARKRKNWTQQQLADRIGVTKWAIGKWEGGQSLLRASAFHLADELGVTFEHIVDGGPLAEGADPMDERITELEKRLSRTATDFESRIVALEELVELLATQTKVALPEGVTLPGRGGLHQGSGDATG